MYGFFLVSIILKKWKVKGLIYFFKKVKTNNKTGITFIFTTTIVTKILLEKLLIAKKTFEIGSNSF